ncbi:MAG: phosphatase PAP2 family protein [Pedobacter sp.]|nr:MAG: phosphatase PAP2 family protein [Pedobacter sp.]
MIKRIKRLRLYFTTLILFVLFACIFLWLFPKKEGFLLLNLHHSYFLDISFRLLTNLGDGLVSLLFILAFVIRKSRKKAITLLLAYASSSILAQVAKWIFDLPRPRLFLDQLNVDYPNFVDGVILYDHHSFPSGHTASAFALATVLVLIFKKKKISGICILLAIIVGYSRIYLAQHFLMDVLVGAILGTSCALVSYYQVYDRKLFRSNKVIKRYRKLNTA